MSCLKIPIFSWGGGGGINKTHKCCNVSPADRMFQVFRRQQVVQSNMLCVTMWFMHSTLLFIWLLQCTEAGGAGDACRCRSGAIWPHSKAVSENTSARILCTKAWIRVICSMQICVNLAECYQCNLDKLPLPAILPCSSFKSFILFPADSKEGWRM